jgi:hypothetical protein
VEKPIGYEPVLGPDHIVAATLAGSKFAFGYDVFAINAVHGDDELAALMERGGAGNLTLGLAGALYQEVASEAREFVRQSLLGRDEVTQKFMRPVRAIREKLAGLAFLDPGIAPLVGSIDEVLAAVPRKGKISGTSLAALRGVVTLLTDPAKMREHGRMMLDGSSKGLLGDHGPNPEEVVSAEEGACGSVGQGVQPPDPAARPVPTPRVSAFW